MSEPRRTRRDTPSGTGSVKQPGDGHPKLLLVDDEPMITSILGRLIGKDHVVHISQSSTEARDRVRSGERFDVIMCDLMMPEMNGMELFAELTKIAPEQASRMIFMTGGAFTDATRSFLDSVPNARLEKPFDVAVVRATIRQVLKQGA